MVLAVVGRLLRQRHLVQRIEVEPLLRGDAGHVRAVEADAEEERPVVRLLQQADRLVGDVGIGLLVVAAVGDHPAQRAAEVAVAACS